MTKLMTMVASLKMEILFYQFGDGTVTTTVLESLATKLAWLLYVHIACKRTLCADLFIYVYMERLSHD